MKAARALHPEDTISHYRIVGPLGAGGMGEVYLAQDQSLERNVALKVLPPDLTQNEERVRRFMLEAKSASSLSHPNIVTIYEIGRDSVHSAAGGDSAAVHFISMELVSGKTLSTLIHDDKVDLRTLLGYLAQAAEGLAKAHAAGIVHRDLKPGNIMVSADGFAKVLDFGLAKLTERQGGDPDATSAPTVVADATDAGAVLGTAGYMSPEQVQGKQVDYRSDIFSFGCILYEAATRRRPFVAETGVETMHKILHDKPEPVEDLNPKVPAELRRLVRRCLAKAPDQRLQSMKDLAIELREIVDEYDTMSASASSGSTIAGAPIRTGRWEPTAAHIGAGMAVLALVAVGAWWWSARHKGDNGPQSFENMRMSMQTNRGDVRETAISPDGRYLAYIARTGQGLFTLRVRQVATGSDVEVVPAQDRTLEGPSFSPDGNYVYYLGRKPDAPNYRALFQVPSLGGSSQQRAFDVDTHVGFSPDTKSIAFWRGVPQSQKATLMVHNLDSGAEKTLTTVDDPEFYNSAPSWSPDGKQIACVLTRPGGSIIALFDARTGSRRNFSDVKAAFFDGAQWLRDGSGLVVSGVDVSAGPAEQLFLLSYPGGRRQRITNDLMSYTSISVSGADEAVAAVRRTTLGNLWVADAAGGPARQLTHVATSESSPRTVSAGGSDLVVFDAGLEREIPLWSVPASGGEPHPLTTGPQYVITHFSASGVVVCERADHQAVRHLFRVDPQDGRTQQLTNGSGETMLDLSHDGKRVTFAKADSTRGVWTVATDGGAETLLSATALAGNGRFSPNGQGVLTFEYGHTADGLIRAEMVVLAAADGKPLQHINITPRADLIDWSPDSQSITYIDRGDSAWNVYRAGSAGAPARVTSFTTGRVTAYRWSPDGTRLAVARLIDGVTNLWVTDGAGEHATQLTQFPLGDILSLAWLPDSRRIVVNAGTLSRDVVLVRNFR